MQNKLKGIKTKKELNSIEFFFCFILPYTIRMYHSHKPADNLSQ